MHNPVAGKGNPSQIQKIFRSVLGADQYDLYETTGEESLREVVQTAVAEKQYAWVAATGGDGTVSQVASGLVGTPVPLAIVPAGTGNALAKELNIPLQTEAACRLLLQQPARRYIDAMRVGEQHFFLQMGIGLESVTMRNTPVIQKNRWGRMAYLWTAVKTLFGWQPHRFTLVIDGQTHQVAASELVIANAGQIGILGLKWRESILVDDGRLDIAVIHARSWADYLQVIGMMLRRRQYRSPHIRYFTARKEVVVQAARPLPVHGDGEMLPDEMPVTAVLVPRAISVLVPADAAATDQQERQE